jgi:protein-glutamine gamma-glutamyltransferase
MNTWAASWTSGALLGRLPRESRDTLFLLVVIAWVLLPLVNHVPLWCTVSVSAILLWRGWLARYSRPLPNRWWRTLVLVGAMAGTLLTYRTLLGREPGVALIVMLLALKTMELRARRDAFVVFFMGFFALLVNFLYSQSLVVAFVMLVGLLGLLTALVHAHKPVGEPRLRDAARTALWMTAAGAPVMALLFVLFPRIGPLWGMPGDAMVGRTGLSDNMRVGQVASLAQDDRVAFRVSFDRTPPRSSALYWRGPVLSRFDGRQRKPAAAHEPAAWAAVAPLERAAGLRGHAGAAPTAVADDAGGRNCRQPYCRSCGLAHTRPAVGERPPRQRAFALSRPIGAGAHT